MLVRPAFSTTTGFFFATRWATSAKARPSLRSSRCWQMICVDIGLVAEAHDGGRPQLRRAREADDRHADAAGLGGERRASLHVVGGAEGRAQVLRRVVEAVDVRAHEADVVLAGDGDDLL